MVDSANQAALYGQQQTGKCFLDAFQHCQAASLTYNEQDSATRLFTIKSINGKCEVLDTLQYTKPETYTCAQLQAFRGGQGALIFIGCGNDGKVTVPINPEIQ